MRKSLALLLSLMMILIVIPVTAASAPAPAPATVAAFGVILDGSGRPVNGAEIELYQLGGGLITTLTTGADGAFRLGQPVPANRGTLWQLRVWAKGFRTKESGWVDLLRTPYQSLQLERISGGLQVTVRDEQGLAPATGIATLVNAAGQLQAWGPLDKGQFGQQELPVGDYRVLVSVPGHTPVTRSVTVAPDRITAAVVALVRSGFGITGEIRDAVTNTPVVGAAVELQRQDQIRVTAATTDSSGRFRLPAAEEEPGVYRLWVTADGYRPTLSQPVTVVQGQEADLSGGNAIALQPATGTIVGTLLNRWGTPQVGARVVLLLQGYGETASTQTAASGSFRFEKIPAGGGNRYAILSPESDHHVLPAWFELPAGTTTQRLLQGQGGSTETVGSSSLTGVVTTPSLAPLDGVKVELLRHNDLITSALTDSSGTFLLPDVGASMDNRRTLDPYMLRFSKDGYASTHEFTAGGESRTDLPLVDRVRANVQAVLHPISADLRGRLTAGDGTPVAGGTARLRSADGADDWTTVTDADGWYTYKAAALRPAVRYAVRAEAKGHLTLGWTDMTDGAGKGQSLPTLKLPSTNGTMTGQVLGPAGESEADVSVSLQGPAGELLAEAKTDHAGYYHITVPLPRTGMLTLTAARTGWSRALAEVTERSGSGAAISRELIIFPETATLEGRAMAAGGAPAGDIWVELLAEGKGVVDSVRTDNTGFFRFDRIALNNSGWFSLRVRTGAGITFGGSLTHGTEVVPLLRLAPGERTVTDLLVTKP